MKVDTVVSLAIENDVEAAIEVRHACLSPLRVLKLRWLLRSYLTLASACHLDSPLPTAMFPGASNAARSLGLLQVVLRLGLAVLVLPARPVLARGGGDAIGLDYAADVATRRRAWNW